MAFSSLHGLLHPRWIFPALFCVAAAAGCGADDASSDGAGASPSTGAQGSGAQGSGASGGSPSGPSSGAGAGGAASSGAGGAPTTFAAMCAAPGVVFCDAFEGAWADDWIEDGGDVQIVPGAAVDGEGASVLELSTDEDTQSSKLLRTFADTDVVHVRFDVQYDAAYDNSGGSHGPILGGSDSPPWGMLGTAGNKPNGSDFFVLNFEPKGRWGTTASSASTPTS